MPLTNSVNQLQRLFSTITQSGNFISNFAEVTSTLRTLLKKEVEFKLNTSQLDAIGKLKLLATSTLSENPNLQTHLKIDANSDKSGALLE